MSLSCERAGYGPNGHLNAIERAQYQRFAWHPPVDRTPPKYQSDSFFDSRRFGKKSYADFPSPMEIDSEVSQQQEDIQMGNTEELLPPKRVQFSPPADYSRPSSSGSNIGPTTALKSALAAKRDRINTTGEHAPYVPKTPYKFNYDVDYSLPSVASNISSVLSSRPSPLKPVGITKEIEERAARETLTDIQRITSRQTYQPPLFSPSIPRAKRKLLEDLEPNTLEQPKLSPQMRKVLSPRSQHTSPAQRERLAPDVLYPNLRTQTSSDYLKPEPEQEPLQEQRPLGRRITGMVVNLVRYIPGIFGHIWGLLGGGKKKHAYQQEIVAVETSPTSGKRRAVAAQDIKHQPSSRLPGYYPEQDETKQTSPNAPVRSATNMTTPPDSRPNSSHSEKNPAQKSSPPAVQPSGHSHRAQEQQKQPEVREQQQAEPQPAAPVAPIRRQVHHDYSKYKYDFAITRRPLRDPSIPMPDPHRRRLPAEILALHRNDEKKDRDAQEREKESKVDSLINKSKQATAESPEQRLARLSISTQKKRREQVEAAKVEAEKRRIAEEEARARAAREAKEAEEARKKAEEEARAKAEEEARVAAEKAAASKEELAPELSEEWQNRIAKAMAFTAPGHVVATSTRKVPITRKDLGCILPQQNEHSMRSGGRAPAGWLNDEGVNAFISAIVDRKNEQAEWKGSSDKNSPAFAAYDCNWYTTYKKNNDISSIRRWSRRQGISGEKLLGVEKVFFPVNTGAHWMLLIISPKDRKIEFLDSMGGPSSNFFRIARDWLKMELGDRYNDADWVDSDVRSESQLNMDDCGVFTCINALASAKHRPFSDVCAVRDMSAARHMIAAVILDGGFGRDFSL